MADIKRKLKDNLKSVKERIAGACDKAGRDPSGVKLIAVTKYVGLDVVKHMVDLGFSDLGESRVQELCKRAGMVNELLSRRPRDPAAGAVPRPRWHMVGHLQRNKVKQVVPWVDMIQSVDSLRLAEEIDTQAGKIDRVIDVLLQVNTSGEPQKHGVAVGAATHLAEHIAPLPHLNLCGLMAMAPLVEDRGIIYDSFVRCQELYDEIVHEVRLGEQFRHLSLGMSTDFEIGIAVGATIVRIGSALFKGIPLADAPDAPESAEATA